MGTGQINDGNDAPERRLPNRRKRKITVGLLALLLLILNTAVFTFSFFAVGVGVDAGMGVGLLAIFFTLPVALCTIFLGILSLTGKQGRVPGTIALSVTAAVLLFGVYGFLDTQVL